jgi:adenine-specific DNA-methyltransferase
MGSASNMKLTDYYPKYLAQELTRRCPADNTEKLAGAVASAQVDLNSHQVDAALPAFKAPLSRGALEADELGMDKTIDAGMIRSRRSAERQRRILVISASNLREQWFQGLTEKFFLPLIRHFAATGSYGAGMTRRFGVD